MKFRHKKQVKPGQIYYFNKSICFGQKWEIIEETKDFQEKNVKNPPKAWRVKIQNRDKSLDLGWDWEHFILENAKLIKDYGEI